MRHLHLITLVLVLVLSAPAAFAQTSNNLIVSKLDTDDMLTLLTEEGYGGMTVDDDGDILFKIEGRSVYLLFSQNKQLLQLRIAWNATSEPAPLLIKINEWNRTKNYSKAYLDSENDPVLELELDMEGGVTVARVKDFVRTARVSIPIFVDTVL